MTCASSSTSSISYLPEMTCGTRCRHSSQNIPKLTSAHWASHQATGRKNHCGAHDDEDRDCRKKRKDRVVCTHLININRIIFLQRKEEKICHITNPSPLHHLTLYLLHIYRQLSEVINQSLYKQMRYFQSTPSSAIHLTLYPLYIYRQ